MTDFKPMLAAKADPDKISYPVLAQPKPRHPVFLGWRAEADFDRGELSA